MLIDIIFKKIVLHSNDHQAKTMIVKDIALGSKDGNKTLCIQFKGSLLTLKMVKFKLSFIVISTHMHVIHTEKQNVIPREPKCNTEQTISMCGK